MRKRERERERKREGDWSIEDAGGVAYGAIAVLKFWVSGRCGLVWSMEFGRAFSKFNRILLLMLMMFKLGKGHCLMHSCTESGSRYVLWSLCVCAVCAVCACMCVCVCAVKLIECTFVCMS